MEFRRVLLRSICFNSWHSITFAVIIRGTTTMGMSERGHELKQLRQLKEIRLRGAEAYYDLGVAYSVGQGDVKVDLVQAHKWFNLAAMAGMRQAQEDRAFVAADMRSEEHTSELQSLMRITYAVFCLKKKNKLATSK